MPEPTENAVYIPEANMQQLGKEIAKLNRRAEKIGCPPVDYFVHDVCTVPDPTTVTNMESYLQRKLTEEELAEFYGEMENVADPKKDIYLQSCTTPPPYWVSDTTAGNVDITYTN